MEVKLSMKNETRGHANLNVRTNVVTIFLPTLTRLLEIPREYFPLNTIEELLEDLVIHEKIHEITGVREDYLVDGWQKIACRLENRLAECNCPIDCYYRAAGTKP